MRTLICCSAALLGFAAIVALPGRGEAQTASASPADPLDPAVLAAKPRTDDTATDGEPADAHEWWRDVKVGATLEGYYEYNTNRPPDRVNVLRAYDTRANTFSLQQAAVVIDAGPDVEKNRRFGLRLDFQFGQATETVQGNPANEPRPDVYRNIWQAFGSYVFPVGRGLRVDFGKFAANLGYETNYAKDNQAFSRAYLFNFLPFYHSGVRATLPLGDKVSVMYAVVNGIQETEDFNNFKSQEISTTLTPTPKINATVNAYFGQEQPDNGAPSGPDGYFKVFDAYVAYAATSALTLAIDTNYTSSRVAREADTLGLRGVGGYARYQFHGPLAIGVRYEHLEDDGLFGGVDQTLQEATLTGEYKFADGFLFRGEYRRDWSNLAFFPGSNPDEHNTGQNTLTGSVIWWVGNKSGAW